MGKMELQAYYFYWSCLLSWRQIDGLIHTSGVLFLDLVNFLAQKQPADDESHQWLRTLGPISIIFCMCRI